MAKKVFLGNEELFYAKEWTAENLYYFLYSMFDDYDHDHFAWRQDGEVCSWSHEEAIGACIDFLAQANNEFPDVKSFFENILAEYDLPDWLTDAVAEVCSVIGADPKLASFIA